MDSIYSPMDRMHLLQGADRLCSSPVREQQLVAVGKLRGLTVASLQQGLQCRELPRDEQTRKTVTFAPQDQGSIGEAVIGLPGCGNR